MSSEKNDQESGLSIPAWRISLFKLGRNSHRLLVVVLGTLLFALVNTLALYLKIDWNLGDTSQRLSERATATLANISGEIDIKVLLPRNHLVYEPLRQLLNHLHEANKTHGKATLNIEFVDPHRDLARATQLSRTYNTTGWNVIFSSGTRAEIVNVDEMIEESDPTNGALSTPPSKRFRGEQLCMTALMRLINPRQTTIYTLTDNGERDFESYDTLTGFSDLAREIRREGYTLKPLSLLKERNIPNDCDLLIVAGPQNTPSPETQVAIDAYLLRGGRALLMFDRLNRIPNGWEPVMKRLGLSFANLTAVDSRTVSGFQLVVDRFGDHPITRNLERNATHFVAPQIIDILQESTPDTGTLPRVEVVIAAPIGAWGESNPEILPQTFSNSYDRKGTLPIVVASQLGVDIAKDVALNTMRAVVFGDSNCGANSMISGGRTGNRDLILNSINWLTQSGLPTAPSFMAQRDLLQLGMSRNRQLRLFQHSVIYWPLAVLLVGLLGVAIRRR